MQAAGDGASEASELRLLLAKLEQQKVALQSIGTAAEGEGVGIVVAEEQDQPGQQEAIADDVLRVLDRGLQQLAACHEVESTEDKLGGVHRVSVLRASNDLDVAWAEVQEPALQLLGPDPAH